MSYSVANVLEILIGDMSEAAFAELVNIPKATINRLLSGRTPDPRASTLIPIADYFGITINQLLGIEPLPSNLPLKNGYHSKEVLFQAPFIPMNKLIDWVNNKYTQEESHTIIKDENYVDNHCYLTQTTSDAMAPQFCKDTHLLVNKAIEPQNNDFGLFYLEDEQQLYFRRLLVEGKEKYLYALHPGFSLLGPFKEIKHIGTVVEGRFKL